MMPEGRFERIEHVIGGLTEERKKDREEFHAWRRDMERRSEQSQLAIDRTQRLLEESIIEHDLQRREERADRMERDRRIDDRIEKLVSAIGAFISR